MKKIKSNWFYIKNFKMNSLFWRTFIIIVLLLIVPFVSLSVVFYSKTFKTMRDEISTENSSLLSSASSIIDDTLIECDTMSSYMASNESVQLYMLNGKNTDSFSALVRLSKTLPIIYKYIDSIYIYSESFDSVLSNGMSLPSDEFADMNWLDGYKSINNQTDKNQYCEYGTHTDYSIQCCLCHQFTKAVLYICCNACQDKILI